MLKLLKYEWKACARTCLPLYGVLILMSLISRILYVIPKNASLDFMLPAISSMLYMGVMMAAFVVTAVILIQRFYKNLLGSEGYLMFTLPVTVSQHLLSKTIIAVVMIALSGIAAFLSIGIFADMSFVTLFVDMIKGVARSGGLLFGLELLVLAVLGIADMALFVYMCMALGHLAGKHRLLMSVVWYVVLSTAVQVLLLMVMMGAGNAMPEALADAMVRWLDSTMQTITPMDAAHLMLRFCCVFELISDAVYFLVTRWILTHKLNLE
ncbi:hypothetical protein [Agathobaculum sp.]|uniref:hypothetical protein n=1 Tax=Agathobaculum sp. TaxID=2048138 RepID=UPI003AF0A36F